MRRSWWAPFAHLPTGLGRDVLICEEDGVFAALTPGVGREEAAQGGASLLEGVVIPGLANCHSHAFHRALRGRTHSDGGTFWTWREGMYRVAARLDPDSYYRLARAVFAEMALAGVTSVGEFHYVHHAPGGAPYADPNAMGEALRAAARDAGVRLTLLDTLYLRGGLTEAGHSDLAPEQLRFADGSAHAWGERLDALRDDATTRIGMAMHSVRAVPFDDLAIAREIADLRGGVVHAHVSEQPAENAAALGFYGRTPVELLGDAGLVSSRFSAVHATHLTERDVSLLGSAGATACFCPTTERDLADGIGPARALAEAGVRLSLGSDQHAVVDLLEEARALEMHERLLTGERGRFGPDALLSAATQHPTIQWDDVGTLAVGERADLVEIDRRSTRTAGSDPSQIVLSASAADVRTVVRDGEVIVTGGAHRLGDVATLLADAIEPLWED